MMKRGAERILRRGGDLRECNKLNRRAIQVFLALGEDEMLNRVTLQHL